MTVQEVLASEKRWSVEQADCIGFLRSLPRGSVDLVFGSPPYMDARTYDDGSLPEGAVTVRDCQEWVDWMLNVTEAAVHASRGLVLWVVSGVQRDKNYWPGCEGLAWEWWKRGNHLWRPCVWWKVDENDGGTGIPGSGGKQWLRNDWEYVLAFKREGWLPWADPLVMGHKPVCSVAGGEMSNRLADGSKANDPWDKHGRKQTVPDHKNNRKKMYARNADGTRDTDKGESYTVPKIANPGNVINVHEDELTLAELTHILIDYEQTTCTTSDQVLRELQQADSTGRLREWFYGVCLQVRAAAFLRHGVRGGGASQGYSSEDLSSLQCRDESNGQPERPKGEPAGVPQEEVLQPQVSGGSRGATGRPKARGTAAPGKENSSADDSQAAVREVQTNGSPSCPPPGRGRDEQRTEQPSSFVSVVPPKEPHAHRVFGAGVRASLYSSGVLLNALPAIQDAWRSACKIFAPWSSAAESGLIIKARVGGGHIGSRLAHSNEAPYPEKLCEFFVRSFCPPKGVTCDPFSGSGTTGAVSIRHGRRFIGCDLRTSQVNLSRSRIELETPPLPGLED